MRLVLGEMAGGRVTVGQIEGHCGGRTWSFCTADEGLRIMHAGVRERLWGSHETQSVAQEICRHLPLDTTDLAELMCSFDDLGQGAVSAAVHTIEGHKTVLIMSGNRVLQNALLPDICSALSALEIYRVRMMIHSGDCITALKQMLEQGVKDTIPDDAFRRLSRGTHRSLRSELALRQSLVEF